MSQQQGTTKQTSDQVLVRRETAHESANVKKEMVKIAKPIPLLDAEQGEVKQPTAMSDGAERTSEEVPKAAVSQSTKQNVGEIKTFKSMSLVGRINDEKSNANFDQQISTVHTTGGGIAIAGVANNVDINALLAKMGQQ
ncbi:hypothetical protein NW752_009096 [Fusarium irregulare]|uniref:Uncharacterized protein n=1 Tax=Fusarium irregulare TaxID=2494466 RepID=A0A9W8PK79_9HYPO|nr:hypothetical protein NW766_008623 [Fusarium irregulare]KAJ4009922.1 hypothetical protein NW752_009096 [Fusarium irregulare]